MAGRDRAAGYDWPGNHECPGKPAPSDSRTPLARTATSCTRGEADARFFVTAVLTEDRRRVELKLSKGQQHACALAPHSSPPSLQSFSVDETHRRPKLSPTSWEGCCLRAHCCLQPPRQPCGQPQSSPSQGCCPSSQGLLFLLRNGVWCTGVLSS